MNRKKYNNSNNKLRMEIRNDSKKVNKSERNMLVIKKKSARTQSTAVKRSLVAICGP